jgi:hypothetical protein
VAGAKNTHTQKQKRIFGFKKTSETVSHLLMSSLHSFCSDSAWAAQHNKAVGGVPEKRTPPEAATFTPISSILRMEYNLWRQNFAAARKALLSLDRNFLKYELRPGCAKRTL